MKVLLVLIIMLFGMADSFAGTATNKQISSVQYVASYSGGPARALYFWLTDGTSYRYMFDAQGNSVEHGRSLMAMLLSAQATVINPATK